MRFYNFDIETFPNCFLFTGKFEDAPEIYQFEISEFVNQRDALLGHLNYLRNCANVYLQGYNNLGFDYPIVHSAINEPWVFDANKAYQLCQQIVGSGFHNRNNFTIRLGDRYLPQIDLFKVNHFDNQAKSTTLKLLQCAMRSESVEDLPFPNGKILTREEVEVLKKYNIHDVTETEKFGIICREHVMMRKELLDQGILSGDVLNYSDVKIGTEFLVKKIGRNKCFVSGSKPKQSFRTEVQFKNVILPKIQFRTEPFQEVLEWFKGQTKYIAKEAENPSLETKLAGITFKFGVGGVHASVEKQVFHSDEDYVIKDIDVSGMYVAVAIANGFAPEHLGQDFTTAYKQLQRDRSQYKKGTAMNLVLKLAGNGVYGNSNNSYSCFYDPKYTFSVTVNGQLQLLQLVELLALIPDLRIIQANTDGITARVPRKILPLFEAWCREWESQTGLKLEEVEYKSMFIRDVNNYIAVDTKGNIKRKGAYQYPITLKDYWGGSGSEWHKNFSNLASVKAAELCMLKGISPEHAIRLISDKFDFMLRYKCKGADKLYIGDKEQQKTLRYYVSTLGEPMQKVAPSRGPIGEFCRARGVSDELYAQVMKEIGNGKHDLRIHTKNKSTYKAVVTKVETGYKIKECNHVRNFTWDDIDYKYYISETKKLIIGT